MIIHVVQVRLYDDGVLRHQRRNGRAKVDGQVRRGQRDYRVVGPASLEWARCGLRGHPARRPQDGRPEYPAARSTEERGADQWDHAALGL